MSLKEKCLGERKKLWCGPDTDVGVDRDVTAPSPKNSHWTICSCDSRNLRSTIQRIRRYCAVKDFYRFPTYHLARRSRAEWNPGQNGPALRKNSTVGEFIETFSYAKYNSPGVHLYIIVDITILTHNIKYNCSLSNDFLIFNLKIWSRLKNHGHITPTEPTDVSAGIIPCSRTDYFPLSVRSPAVRSVKNR